MRPSLTNVAVSAVIVTPRDSKFGSERPHAFLMHVPLDECQPFVWKELRLAMGALSYPMFDNDLSYGNIREDPDNAELILVTREALHMKRA